MNARDRILNSAILLAKQYGWRNLKRDSVAREAGCATGSVNHYYDTMDALRTEVMRIAVERRIAPIVLEGLAAKHPEALRADHDLRAEVLLSL